jgi:hypothetical protein
MADRLCCPRPCSPSGAGPGDMTCRTAHRCGTNEGAYTVHHAAARPNASAHGPLLPPVGRARDPRLSTRLVDSAFSDPRRRLSFFFFCSREACTMFHRTMEQSGGGPGPNLRPPLHTMPLHHQPSQQTTTTCLIHSQTHFYHASAQCASHQRSPSSPANRQLNSSPIRRRRRPVDPSLPLRSA